MRSLAMAFINLFAREICCKVVYAGPGLSGKTTNVEWIYERTAALSKGRMLSLKTDSERTLFFDFLPLELGSLGGYKARLQIYTVPGQIYYGATRRLILRGADGVVFVADSQRARLEANEESLADVRDCLNEHNLADVAFVLQYNKRDLPDVATVEELHSALNPDGHPETLACAATGVGVQDTLKLVTRRVLQTLKARHGVMGNAPDISR
ncbi:MAG: GTPase domain-containing protein [Polyangiaceae bacterium]